MKLTADFRARDHSLLGLEGLILVARGLALAEAAEPIFAQPER